jgi:hypothetical protein
MSIQRKTSLVVSAVLLVLKACPGIKFAFYTLIKNKTTFSICPGRNSTGILSRETRALQRIIAEYLKQKFPEKE